MTWRSAVRRSGGSGLLISLAIALAGCSGGFEDTMDTLGNFNPLKQRETILPGERRSLIAEEALIDQEFSNGTASIGGASGGEWTQAGSNAQNDAGHRSFASPANLTFRANLGGGNKNIRIFARPVVSGGTIFVYKPDGSVIALSNGGGRLWERSMRPEKERQSAQGGGLTTDGRIVYVASGYQKFAALNAANGAELWSVDLPTPAEGAPTVAGDTVYVVTQDSELIALSTADGSEKWTNQGIPEAAGVLGAASPAVSGGKVVVPTAAGELIGLDAKSGEVEWIEAFSTGNRIMAISGLSDLSASPVIAGGFVYATSVSGRTIAVNLSNGHRVWDQNIGSPFTPIVSGNAVFMVDINNGMTALDRKSGKPLWRTQLPRAEKDKDRLHWVGPVLAGGALYAASADGNLIQVDPASGQIVSNQSIGDGVGVQPIVSGGQMIMVSTRNVVMGFN